MKRVILAKNGLLKYYDGIEDINLYEEILEDTSYRSYSKGTEIFVRKDSEKNYIVTSGRITIEIFITDQVMFSLDYNVRENIWLGSNQIFAENFFEYRIQFKEESKVLDIPIKKLIDYQVKYKSDLLLELNKRISERSNYFFKVLLFKNIFKNEILFLEFLIKSGYKCEEMTLNEISSETFIPKRTLQRIINDLIKKNLLNKVDRFSLEVSNRTKFLKYYNETQKQA